jgi:hypothetical protein
MQVMPSFLFGHPTISTLPVLWQWQQTVSRQCVFLPVSLQWSNGYSPTIEENWYYLYVSSAILITKIRKFCHPGYFVLYSGFKCLEGASRFTQNLRRPALHAIISMPW